MEKSKVRELERKVKVVNLNFGEVSIHNVPHKDFEILKKLGIYVEGRKERFVIYGGVIFSPAERAGD